MKTKKKKGFTLTELIVVIVIIGVLAAVLIPSLTGYITKAQNAKDETLVISLNKELNLRKIEDDDLEFYTAYDVQTYLKSVGMENIEVSNKNNLILFDTVEKKFVLVKDKDEVLSDSKTLLQKNEFVYHISEYYSINHHYYDAEDDEPSPTVTATVMRLGYTKLSTEDKCGCGGKHRAFIISINGPEIAKAVKAVMDLPLDKNDASAVNDINDSELKELISDSITKTVYVNNEKAFYYDSNFVKHTFINNEYDPKVQKLTRVIILPEVEEVDLSQVSNLQKSTITLPGTSDDIINYDSLADNISFIGNVDILKNKGVLTECIDEDYQKAYSTLEVKEITFIDSYVRSGSQLISWIDTYNEYNKEGSTLKQQITDAGLTWDLPKTIIIMSDMSVDTPVTIPEGITLFIPYDTEKTNLSVNEDKNTEIPDHANTDGDPNYSRPFAHTVLDKNGKPIYRTIELTINSTLTVMGRIIVGGITGDGSQGLEGHTSDKYSQITLNKNGKIILEKGTELDCYGYIIGDGEIIAKENSVIIQPFVVGDFIGGLISYELYQKRRTPFDEYALVNIQSNVYLEYGSYYKGMPKIYVSTAETYSGYNNYVSIIAPSGGLINVEEGTDVSISYDDSQKLEDGNNKYFDAVGKTTINVFGKDKKGKATTGNLAISLNILITVNIDTDNFTLPVPYNFTFNFSNGDYAIDSDFALLPGAEINIANDSSLTINEDASLYVLPASESGFTNNAYPKSTVLKSKGYNESGKLCINGSLNVKGTLAGNIETNYTKDMSETTPKVSVFLTANTQKNFLCVRQWSSFKAICQENHSNWLNHLLSGLKCLHLGHQFGITVNSLSLYTYTCYDEHSGDCWELSPTSIIFGTSDTNKRFDLKLTLSDKELQNGYIYNYDGESWKEEKGTIYTVSFVSKGDTTDITFSNVKVLKDGTLTNYINTIETITKNKNVIAYKFVGLYKDEALTKPWFFDTDTITKDEKLYIKWQKVWIVDFYDDDGNILYTKYVDQNTSVERPDFNPVKISEESSSGTTNYTFDNWYTKQKNGEVFNFTQPITANTNIYARWKKN